MIDIFGEFTQGWWSDLRREAHELTEEALIKIGEPAIDHLITALNNPHPDIRNFAVWILGELGNPHALEPLLQCLLQDNPWYIRTNAATSLGKLGDLRAVEPLLNTLLSVESHNLRVAIVKTIIRLKGFMFPPLLETLKSDNAKLRRVVMSVLESEADAKIVPYILPLLKDTDHLTRESAIRALINLGDAQTVAPALIEIFRDVDNLTCSNISLHLKKFGKFALQPLMTLLEEDAPKSREQALIGLGYLGDEFSVEAIMQTLRSDENPRVRTKAAQALGRLADKRAVDALIEALKDVKEVRQEAAYALGEIGDLRALTPLLELKNSGTGDYTVKQGLAGLGTFESITAAMQDGFINWSMVSDLVALNDPRAIDVLIKLLEDEDSDVVALAIKGLAKFGKLAVEPLLANLGRENIYTRVLKTLSIIGDVRALDAFIVALNDRYDRYDAMHGLGKIQDPRSVEALKSIVAVESQALRELGKIGQLAFPTLVAFLHHERSHIRVMAAQGFSYAHDTRIIGVLHTALKDTQPEYNEVSFYSWILEAFTELDNLDKLQEADLQALLALVEPIMKYLISQNVRYNLYKGLEILERVNDVRSVNLLIYLLGSEEYYNKTESFSASYKDERICDGAARLLLKFATPEAITAVEMWRQEQIEKARHNYLKTKSDGINPD